MAGPHYLIYDKVTGFLTHVTDDPTVASSFNRAGAAVLDWPSTVYPTMAVVAPNVSTGFNIPTLVGVSGADLPVPPVSSSTSATVSATSAGVVSGGVTSA